MVFWLGLTSIAHARINTNMCRVREAWRSSNLYGQEVCILKLKRSAKNYWEYRAQVSIDGEQQKNPEVYNCRDRTLTRKGKYPIPFQPNSPGELVCQTFQRQINTYKPSRW
jgi:hypothetical protein